PRDLDPRRLGSGAYRVESLKGRGLTVVREVHRDLDPSALGQVEAQGLDRLHPAVPLPDLLCDALGEGQVSRVEVDVERDEEEARADGRGARGRVDRQGPEVRSPCGVLDDRLAQALELP